MSIKERISKIEFELESRKAMELKWEKNSKEAEDLKNKNLVKDCFKLLEIFDINKSLSEVNKEIMNSGAKIEQFSDIYYYNDDKSKSSVEAKTVMTWRKGGKLCALGAKVGTNNLGFDDNLFEITFYYPDVINCFGKQNSLRVNMENINDKKHYVDKCSFLEHKSYSIIEIKEACQDKIATICIDLKEQDLLP